MEPLAAHTYQDLVSRALAEDPSRTAEVLPEDFTARRKLWKYGDAIHFLHTPPPRG